jgi:hypothetical protein
LSDVNFKLIRAVDKFDPAKGSAFTFVSQVISNVLRTSVTTARKDLQRYRKLTAESRFETELQSRRSIRHPSPREQAASSRWTIPPPALRSLPRLHLHLVLALRIHDRDVSR